MDKMKVVQELKEIIVRALDLKITPDEIEGSNLEAEIHVNSIDVLEVLVWVENQYKIEIPDEDLNAHLVNNLYNLAEYIQTKLSKGA